jgi:hypothetical protein
MHVRKTLLKTTYDYHLLNLPGIQRLMFDKEQLMIAQQRTDTTIPRDRLLLCSLPNMQLDSYLANLKSLQWSTAKFYADNPFPSFDLRLSLVMNHMPRIFDEIFYNLVSKNHHDKSRASLNGFDTLLPSPSSSSNSSSRQKEDIIVKNDKFILKARDVEYKALEMCETLAYQHGGRKKLTPHAVCNGMLLRFGRTTHRVHALITDACSIGTANEIIRGRMLAYEEETTVYRFKAALAGMVLFINADNYVKIQFKKYKTLTEKLTCIASTIAILLWSATMTYKRAFGVKDLAVTLKRLSDKRNEIGYSKITDEEMDDLRWRYGQPPGDYKTPILIEAEMPPTAALLRVWTTDDMTRIFSRPCHRICAFLKFTDDLEHLKYQGLKSWRVERSLEAQSSRVDHIN